MNEPKGGQLTSTLQVHMDELEMAFPTSFDSRQLKRTVTVVVKFQGTYGDDEHLKVCAVCLGDALDLKPKQKNLEEVRLSLGDLTIAGLFSEPSQFGQTEETDELQVLKGHVKIEFGSAAGSLSCIAADYADIQLDINLIAQYMVAPNEGS